LKYYPDEEGEDEEEEEEEIEGEEIESIRQAFPAQFPPSLTIFKVYCSRKLSGIVSLLHPSLPSHVKFIVNNNLL
jgi:hypothetical protein